ncbi:MAG: 2-isopropylmalate synthase, partial [Gemmatimonadales bacterium]
ATTVESFFAGATQLETTVNGLGERAGNTNLCEVACVLQNCSVEVPLRLEEIYESALLMAEWSRVPLPEKAPLVGADVISHRSGIHQDGTVKTKGQGKGAYRAFDLTLIGREEGDRLGFTSQSGKTAVFEILHGAGLPITLEEAARLQPALKKLSEAHGELSEAEIVKVYEERIFNAPGPLRFLDMTADHGAEQFTFHFEHQGREQRQSARATGPIEACTQMLHALGIEFHLVEYRQQAMDAEHAEAAAYALSEIVLRGGREGAATGPLVIGRGKDTDTVKANVKAIFNGVNLLLTQAS